MRWISFGKKPSQLIELKEREKEIFMRIDKFLKVSRIIKRRTLASEACDKEKININGRVAKPGTKVSEGDIIEIRFGDRTTKLKVQKVAEHVKKEEATQMYEIL